LISDTVGFIEKLPHHLIQAFKATLEELSYANVLIFVMDAFHPQREHQRDVVLKTLENLKLSEKRMITVYNKMDKDIEMPLPRDNRLESVVEMSAYTAAGKECLLDAIQKVYNEGRQRITVLIPYKDSRLVSYVHQNCEIITETHEAGGTYFELIANKEAQNRLGDYKVVAV